MTTGGDSIQPEKYPTIVSAETNKIKSAKIASYIYSLSPPGYLRKKQESRDLSDNGVDRYTVPWKP